jgi:uncharacterized damage-inducible protein DinB
VTYYGGKELAASFRLVRSNTIQIAEEIAESQYDFRAAPSTRSAGQLLVHIALAAARQRHFHANRIDDLKMVNFAERAAAAAAEEARPRTKTEILDLLRTEGEAFAGYLESLPESFLAERVKMPPGADPATKSRFEMLMSVKEHEMHHRGQLMVIERMLGIVPHLTRQRQERLARAQAQSGQQ